MTESVAGTEWRLCWTTRSKVQSGYLSPLLEGWEDLEESERSLGIRPGQPFLLRPDGSADRDVLAFFNSAAFRTLARGSQESYAFDLKVHLSFLSGQGVDWRDADEDDLLDFEYWRRRDPDNPARVGGAKFGRELAACNKFYKWQVSRDVMGRSPVVVDESRTSRFGDGSRAELTPTDVRSVRVKWLTPRAYRLWRDVGLGGYTAEGIRQKNWRGRNDGRNMAFADVTWSSGLRLREVGTLLLAELPVAVGNENYVRGRVGGEVAKGSSRDFWMSRRALNRVDAYVRSSRQAAIRRAQHAGRYDEVPNPMVMEKITRNREVVYRDARGRSGNRVSLDSLDVDDRARLFTDGPAGLEPAALWLTEFGTPMPYRTWEAVFDEANRRCEIGGVDIHCHPHMLRHSFALRMLVTLFHAFDKRLGLTEEERLEYRLILGDPWVMVQTMLGHTNVRTTKSYYLEPVKGLQIEMFLNADDDETETLDDLMSRVAMTSPQIVDVPRG